MGSSSSTSAAGSKSDLTMNSQCYIDSPEKKTTFEWHLNDRNNCALKKTKNLRLPYEKLYVPRPGTVS